MQFKMRQNICFRLHLRQLVKVALLLSILWLAISSIWNHWRSRVDVLREDNVSIVSKQSQSHLDYISSNLRIHYQLIRNEEKTFSAEVTLTNSGDRSIDPCCWSIIFYHLSLIQARNIRKGSAGSSLQRQTFVHDDSIAQQTASESGFEVIHLNGNTYRLNALKGFQGIRPGAGVKVTLRGQRWIVSRSQVLPKWYVASDDPSVNPRLLASTIGDDLDFVGSFDSDDQILRSSEDALRPFGPEKRFEMNAVGKDMRGALYQGVVLPTPMELHFGTVAKKELLVEPSLWSISYGKGLEVEATYLKDRFEIESTEELRAEDGVDPCSSRTIFLSADANLALGNITDRVKSMSEAYRLTIDPDRECVSIEGISSAGVFYGAVSLWSLAKRPSHAEAFAVGAELSGGGHSKVELIDGPRYEHRGIMIDVARNYRSKDEIMRLIDLISMYKMNKLHIHLTDDEGWRLEIPGLEELTQFGGRRGHDPDERFHLMSMLGSGPFTNSSGSGFYSRSTYRDILRHAQSRHVEIIPEFDMPGHSHAAVRSMERRRARLMSEGHESQANDYVLLDPLDRSEFLSAQFFFDGVMNPCLDSTYRFINHVVAEVVRMHKDIQPLHRFHFGGDEVPNGAYVDSPVCKAFLSSHPSLSGLRDLKRHFVREVAAIVSHHGATVEGWEDAFSDSSTGKALPLSEMKGKEVVSQAWYNIWERGFAHRAYEYANNGYKVILTPATAFYFDNPQEPDPEDWGLHWATRYIDTRRTFFFAPDSLYDNIDFDFFGKRITRKDMCKTKKIECPELTSPQNVIGLEAALWSEVVRTSDRMDSMLFPRLLAVAERAWHKAAFEVMQVNCDDDNEECDEFLAQRNGRANDWTLFANTIGYKELRRLEELGVNYYMPRPGARVVEGRLEVNTLFPGLVVQTSQDGGRSWVDFHRDSTYKGDVLLATRSFDGKRRSPPVQVKVV